jgi:hypothetical protein
MNVVRSVLFSVSIVFAIGVTIYLLTLDALRQSSLVEYFGDRCYWQYGVFAIQQSLEVFAIALFLISFIYLSYAMLFGIRSSISYVVLCIVTLFISVCALAAFQFSSLEPAVYTLFCL